MTAAPVKVALLCCDGFFQRYLASRLEEAFTLAGIAIYRKPSPKGSLAQRILRKANPVALARHLAARSCMRREYREARETRERLFHREGRPPEFPAGIPQLVCTDINSPAAVRFVAALQADVVCVNGTNLLRKPMLALAPGIPLGVINMHTGLSPYARGGNCNLHMLIEGRPEYVGVTIHHVDPGIDSGDIILTGRPDLDALDTFETIELKNWRLGVDLMVEAVRRLAAGRAERVKQWEEGRLFLRRTGYAYDPALRVKVARRLRSGLVRDYLTRRDGIDRCVRIVG